MRFASAARAAGDAEALGDKSARAVMSDDRFGERIETLGRGGAAFKCNRRIARDFLANALLIVLLLLRRRAGARNRGAARAA